MDDQLLKADELGRIALGCRDGRVVICHDVEAARWWARRLARRVAAREARALTRLQNIQGVRRVFGYWDNGGKGRVRD